MRYINLRASVFFGDKYFIKNDIETFRLFFVFFMHRPKCKYKIFIHIFESFIYTLGIIFFKTKINLFFSKEISEEFLVKKFGSGNYPNSIILKKDKYDQLVIRKEFYSEKYLEKEQEYFLKYYNNKTDIKLPNFNFGENFSECSFIDSPSLKVEINNGKYSKEEIINIFLKISSLLDFLYEKEKCLIHGDLTPDNIYLIDDKIYFIDYSDSEFYFKNYDKFTLLERILRYYACDKKEILYYLNKYDLNKDLFWNHLKNKNIEKHFVS